MTPQHSKSARQRFNTMRMILIYQLTGDNMVDTIDELIAHRNLALEVLAQVADDVESVVKTGDHALFYERMVANLESIINVLETQ